jgi:hypothetical protein
MIRSSYPVTPASKPAQTKSAATPPMPVGTKIRFKEGDYRMSEVCIQAGTWGKVCGYEYDSAKENVLCYWVQIRCGVLVRCTDAHIEKVP